MRESLPQSRSPTAKYKKGSTLSKYDEPIRVGATPEQLTQAIIRRPAKIRFKRKILRRPK